MFKWNAPMFELLRAGKTESPSDCLILGKESYMKVFNATSTGERTFVIKYATYDIDGSFKKQYRLGESGWEMVINLHVEGYDILDVSIPLGSSSCVELPSGIELCEAWGSPDVTYDTMPPV